MQDHTKLLARYANWFNIGHNNFEVVMDFGQHYAGDEETMVHTRIVLGPAYAKILNRLLTESLARFEREFGEIPAAGDDEPRPPC